MNGKFDVEIIFEPLYKDVRMPEYNDEDGDMGLDVFAVIRGDEGKDFIDIWPGETQLLALGFKVGIPEGWELAVRPRSGISLKTPLRVANSPGTIDSNYKDEVKVIISNTSCFPDDNFNVSELEEDVDYIYEEFRSGGFAWELFNLNTKGNKHGIYRIKNGDKIAQLVPERRYKAKLTKGIAASIGTDRGGGFGSSDVETAEDLITLFTAPKN